MAQTVPLLTHRTRTMPAGVDCVPGSARGRRVGYHSSYPLSAMPYGVPDRAPERLPGRGCGWHTKSNESPGITRGVEFPRCVFLLGVSDVWDQYIADGVRERRGISDN